MQIFVEGIPAKELFSTDVMFVTKGDRLGARNPYFRDIGGAIERDQNKRQRDNESDATKNTDSGDRIGARVKNLRHRLSLAIVKCVT